jgi:hypothetical protein
METRRLAISAVCGAALATISVFPGWSEPVDVELIIAADVSLSMSHAELRIQRDGYMAAITHDSVINAIRDGAHGRIAIAMFEWAGENAQYLVVPWTIIETREDAEGVAARMAQMPPQSARRTSISSALDFASDLFAESGFSGDRRVVDISGDGPNNHGSPVIPARDALIAQGITINGLPLMTNAGPAGRFDLPDLDEYYRNCVTGGPGSFIVPVNDWDQFADAIRRKLVLELAGPWSPTWRRYSQDAFPILHAQFEPVVGYDCLVGERRWGLNWEYSP